MKSKMGVSRKVIAGGAAGSVTVILVWVVQEFGKVAIPAEVSSAVTTLVSFVFSMFIADFKE